jgi:hypothetical protein
VIDLSQSFVNFVTNIKLNFNIFYIHTKKEKNTSTGMNCVSFYSRLLNQSPSVVSVLVQKNKTGKRSQKNSSPVQTVATAVRDSCFPSARLAGRRTVA